MVANSPEPVRPLGTFSFVFPMWNEEAIIERTVAAAREARVAGKAVALKEAATPEFVAYAKRIRQNAVTLAGALEREGLRIVSGGTDNHLMLVDVKVKGFTGKDVQEALDRYRVTLPRDQ